MRRFVIGDIHGKYKKLKRVLQKSNFDFDNDMLISLGDIVDRGKNVKECFDLLFTIKNLIVVRGNHEDWCLNYYNKNRYYYYDIYQWLDYGEPTIKSFGEDYRIYIDFIEKTPKYFMLENKLFVHAGVCLDKPIELMDDYDLMWNRGFVLNLKALGKTNELYNEIYIGHTIQTDVLNIKNVWMVDTGSYKEDGKITMLDIDTKEYFQS